MYSRTAHTVPFDSAADVIFKYTRVRAYGKMSAWSRLQYVQGVMSLCVPLFWNRGQVSTNHVFCRITVHSKAYLWRIWGILLCLMLKKPLKKSVKANCCSLNTAIRLFFCFFLTSLSVLCEKAHISCAVLSVFSHTALLSEWDPWLSFTKMFLYRKSSSCKYVKWETYKTVARSLSKINGHVKRRRVSHWPSEAHQHYSQHSPGTMGTGGTDSLLKPPWAIFHG